MENYYFMKLKSPAWRFFAFKNADTSPTQGNVGQKIGDISPTPSKSWKRGVFPYLCQNLLKYPSPIKQLPLAVEQLLCSQSYFIMG